MKAFIPLLMCFVIAEGAFASEEVHAIWSSVEIATDKIAHAGRVTVSAKTSGAGISKLTISAFGRVFNVAGDELKKIADYPIASIQITHEGGYEILGGYTVHLRLRRTYYDSDKKLRDEIALVSVSEKKGLAPVKVIETR